SVNTPINVSIYDGNTLITTVLANQSRPDVGNYVGGNGLHGYSIPTPAGLKDGQPHSISVKFEQSSTQLINSPKTINCGSAPAPSITSIQPNQVVLNQATTLTVNGSNFQSGFSATVITPNGTFPINSAGLTFISANQVQVQVTLGGTLSYTATLRITNPGNQSADGTFQAVPPTTSAPTISSISPSEVTVNQTTTLTINGSNFQNGFAATVITINGSFPIASSGLTFVNSNQVKVQVAMGGSPPYNATLRITNPDGKSADGTFQVVRPAPSISSISPSTPFASTSNQDITVNGSNFLSGLTVDVTFPDGGGTTLSGTQIFDVTSSSFKMRIAPNSSGGWGIRVRNPDTKVSSVFNFTVRPQITSISPSSPPRSSTNQNITVNGSGFRSGLTVTITFPSGGSTTLSGTQIQNVSNNSFVMVAALNASGSWSIKVNNPNQSQSSNTFGFTVP
ncbi:MAG TPA: IPT/TIG domain-containing protein, partial [Pyrinomonadaceae bacterium]